MLIQRAQPFAEGCIRMAEENYEIYPIRAGYEQTLYNTHFRLIRDHLRSHM